MLPSNIQVSIGRIILHNFINNYSYRQWCAPSPKCEQFRRYLEKSGVLDTLTKVLVALYEEPEKPNSALDFLKHHLGAGTPENPEIELLRLELAEMKEKYEATIEENKKLKAKLAQYEQLQEEKSAE
ncbi:C-Myc-binding protein [Heterocephalus glaber]|uniref:c-Myc-binding protein n=1 Tax=Heterocephalus glaber TaxID=10181 RepID=G5AT95_HETGA|nr:C-Myc-binding protein [Heterocephalus glaber]